MNKRRERGSALPLILWVLAVLLVISLSFSFLIQSRVHRMGMLFNRFQAYLQASSSAQFGLNLLLTGTRKPTEILTAEQTFFPEGIRYFLDGTPVSSPLFGEKTRLSFQDYSGLINLRMLRPELLDGLLAYFGMPDDKRKVFIDGLLDWADPDDLVRLNGAEKDYYEPLGYRPRNAPPLNLDEILMIRGMDEALYQKIEPYLALGASLGVNPNSAPFEVLMSFPHMTEESARRIMEARKFGYIKNVDELSTISGINYGFYEGLFTFTSDPFLIVRASAPIGEDSWYTIFCLMEKELGSSRILPESSVPATLAPEEPGGWTPYNILSWREQVR